MISLMSLLGAKLWNVRSNSDGSIQAQCPECKRNGRDAHGNHLRVYPNGKFNCVVDNSRDHNRNIRALIYDNVDPSLLPDTVYIDPEPKLDIDPIFPDSMLTKLVPDYAYWRGRGIDEEVVRKLEGGLAPPDKSKLSSRFVFPIRHHQTRKIMGFTGRLVDDASFGPNWKHLFKSGKAVYPLTLTKDAILKAGKVVLIESLGDCLALMSCGIDNVLVLFGLNLNSRMVGFLVGANVDVIISTNNDEGKTRPDGSIYYPGQQAAEAARVKLAAVLGEDKVRVRLPSTRKDWGLVLQDKTGELEVFKGELGL